MKKRRVVKVHSKGFPIKITIGHVFFYFCMGHRTKRLMMNEGVFP